MKGRRQEYVIITILNVLLVFYTNIFLYGIPYAQNKLFDVHTYLSVLGWTMYAGSMYLVLVWGEGSLQSKGRHLATALLVGIVTALLKAVIDVLTNYPLVYVLLSNTQRTTVKGVRNGMFGFLFLFFLFRFFSKRKCRLVNTAKKQEKAVAIVIVFYVLVLILIQIGIAFYMHSYLNAYINALETQDFFGSFTSMATLGIDEVNFANKWFLAIFMTMSWWLMHGYYGEVKEDTPIVESE